MTKSYKHRRRKNQQMTQV